VILRKFSLIPAAVVSAAALTTAGLQPALAVAASPVSVSCSPAALASAMGGAAGGETIRLAAGCDYVLTAALPPVSASLTIKGRGATLERSTAPGTPGFSLLDISTGNADLSVSDLTFRNGDGGAISIPGYELLNNDVAVTHSTFTGNSGGAIDLGGVLPPVTAQAAATITDSVFTGNTGGAINDHGLPLTVTRSTFAGNTSGSSLPGQPSGGGINAHMGELSGSHEVGAVTVTGSTFTRNTGGGIACDYAYCDLTVTRSVFIRNADSGISITADDGSISVAHSVFRCNTSSVVGGGIDFASDESGDLTATNDVFTGNTAALGGGGIYNLETATLTGDSFTGNSAADGGAVLNDWRLTATGTAFRNNKAKKDGGAIYKYDVFGSGTLSITGGRITGNTAGGDGGGIYNSGPHPGGADVSPSTAVRNNQPDNCAPLGSVANCTG
jgi:predicted outer membrane repeat protein